MKVTPIEKIDHIRERKRDNLELLKAQQETNAVIVEIYTESATKYDLGTNPPTIIYTESGCFELGNYVIGFSVLV